MMAKWTGLEKPITAADAEVERDQLFDRPQRPMSRELAALFARLDTARYRPWRKPRIERGNTLKEQR